MRRYHIRIYLPDQKVVEASAVAACIEDAVDIIISAGETGEMTGVKDIECVQLMSTEEIGPATPKRFRLQETAEPGCWAGLRQDSEMTVTEAATAIQVGSGDLPVLATPMMMALMENAAMLAVKDLLPDGCTTVGGQMESSHLRPSKVGDTITAVAEVVKVDGRKISFKVAAYCGEHLLGEGFHVRFIVDRKRFLDQLNPSTHSL